jgi:SAM-dependent methyltransferase
MEGRLMSADKLAKNGEIWAQKKVLREIYHDFYERIQLFLKDGITLEIGGGTGNLKEYAPNVISSDIIDSPWLDCVFDAQAMPYKDDSITNIVAIDVLHHIEFSIRFFREANRVLKEGGRIILLEPAVTLVSYSFYHFVHEEDVILSQNPLLDGIPNPSRKPFDANQAIPTLIFYKYKKEFSKLFPELKILKKQCMSLIAYPLSGGFQKWCLVPLFLVKSLLYFEKVVEPWIGRIFGFRIFVVIEKRSVS